MRFYITIALFLVATAIAAAPSNIVVLLTVYKGGEGIEYRTDIETLKRTPDWTPGKQEPPLAVSDACRIAVEAGRRLFPKAENISIRSVMLGSTASTAHGPADIVRWHYEVHIIPVVGGKIDFFDSGTHIVILMDGSVIEPTRTGPITPPQHP
jgi:hypothetical protein